MKNSAGLCETITREFLGMGISAGRARCFQVVLDAEYDSMDYYQKPLHLFSQLGLFSDN